jgi:hypothetical protein
MRKKSQGLSITTIIVAAIALIVLVVLIAIFTGRLGGFSSGVRGAGLTCEQSCKAAGYTTGSTGSSTNFDTTITNDDGTLAYCKCS